MPIDQLLGASQEANLVASLHVTIVYAAYDSESSHICCESVKKNIRFLTYIEDITNLNLTQTKHESVKKIKINK